MPDVDDFSNLPLDELADDLEVFPSEDDEKEQRLRSVLEKANPKSILLGKGKVIASAAAKAKPIDVIASRVDLSPDEVRPLAEAVATMDPGDQKHLQQTLTPGNHSVFDLDQQLQILCNEIVEMNKILDVESELRVPLFGTRLQVLKLAMTYMKEAEFMKKLQADHEEEMAVVLEELRNLDAAAANKLFARLEERKRQKRILTGRG